MNSNCILNRGINARFILLNTNSSYPFSPNKLNFKGFHKCLKIHESTEKMNATVVY